MSQSTVYLIVEALGLNEARVEKARFTLREKRAGWENISLSPFEDDGLYEVQVEPGKYVLNVESEGYRMYQADLEVKADGEPFIQVQLEAEAKRSIRFGKHKYDFVYRADEIGVIPESDDADEVQRMLGDDEDLTESALPRSRKLKGKGRIGTGKRIKSLVLKRQDDGGDPDGEPRENARKPKLGGKRRFGPAKAPMFGKDSGKGRTIASLRALPGVAAAGPILAKKDDSMALLTQTVTVTFDYRTSRTRVAEIFAEVGALAFQEVRGTGSIYAADFPEEIGIEVLDVMEELFAMPEVEAVEPMIASTVEEEVVVPNDWLWPATWSRNPHTNTGLAWEELQNHVAANQTYGNPNVVIGVIDTGILSVGGVPQNPDFQGTVSVTANTNTTAVIAAPSQVLTVVTTAGILVGARVDIGRGGDTNKLVQAVNAGLNQITVDPLLFDHPRGTAIFPVGGGATITTLNAAVAATTVNVTVGSAAGFSVGQSISVGAEGGANTEQGVITNIAGNTLSIRGLFLGHPNPTPIQSGRKVYRYWDFNLANFSPDNDASVNSDHGLNCAGIATARGNNNVGSAGMAPNARVMGLDARGITQAEYQQEFEWTAGLITYNSNPAAPNSPRLIQPGADILTVSLGIGKPAAAPGPLVGAISAQGNAALLNLTRRGRNSRGTLIFMSAGNDDRQQDRARWSSHPNTFSCAATWMGRFNAIGPNPAFNKEVKAYYSCYTNPNAGPGLPAVPVTWAGISGYSGISAGSTSTQSDFNAPHNPSSACWIIAPTYTGQGNVPTQSISSANVTALVPATMNTWLTEGVISGQTFIVVNNSAGINPGDFVLLGAWQSTPAPVYYWLQVTGTGPLPGQINITAASSPPIDIPCINLGAAPMAFLTVGAPGAGANVTINLGFPNNLPTGSLIQIGGVTHVVRAIANNAGNSQLTVFPNVGALPAGTAVTYLAHAGDTVAVGATTITVNSTVGFAAGNWILLGNPAAQDCTSGLIHQIIGPTQLRVSGPFYQLNPGDTLHAGPNDYNNRMNGTSAATPYCAGVGALVLTAKPTLTWLEVRDIMSNSAFKVDVGTRGFQADPVTGSVLQSQRNGYGPVGIGQWRDAGGNNIMLPAGTIDPAGNPGDNLGPLANQGDVTITVGNGANFSVGQAIEIGAGANRDYSTIKAIAGNVLTIEPLTLGHAAGTAVQGGRTPVISDWYGAGRIDPVKAVQAALAYSHDNRDLMIRNFLADNGTVATNLAANPIHSPDIFLRRANDVVGGAPIPYANPGPHQNPDNGINVPTYRGGGLDDLLVRGFYTGAGVINFVVEIDSIGPDTYKWSTDNGATFPIANVAIVPNTDQPLNNGVLVNFPVNAGHAVGDRWSFQANPTALFFHVRVRNRGNAQPSLAGTYLRFYFAMTSGDLVGNGNTPFYFPPGWNDSHLITANVAANSNNESITYLIPNPAATNPNNYGVLLPNDTPINAPIAQGTDQTFVTQWQTTDLPPANTTRKFYMLAEVLPHDGVLGGLSPDENNNVSYRQILFGKIMYRDADGTALSSPIFTDPSGPTVTNNFTATFNAEIGNVTTKRMSLKITRDNRDTTTETATYHWDGAAWSWVGGAPAWAVLNPPTKAYTAIAAEDEDRAVTFAGSFNHSRDFNKVTMEFQVLGTNSNAVIFEDKTEFVVTDRGLLIRDNLQDKGLVAVDPALVPVHSPDIWMRRADDPVTPPPPFDADGSHQNPFPTADRYVFVRLKNMGVKDDHLAADIKLYVALSSGANAADISTPFKHPDNWQPGTPIANITTDALNTYSLGSTAILAANIPKSNESDWETTDSSNRIVKFTWNQADIPPVATANRIFLLAEVSPHDGKLKGPGSENNRNLSYREIVFCDSTFKDGTGSALPAALDVDNLGTPVTQAFQVDLVIGIGSVLTENTSLRLVLQNDNATEEIALFEHNGAAWAWNGVAPTWANANAPVVTGGAVLAVGSQTTITFTGDFSAAMQHNMVRLEVLIKSPDTAAIIGREFKEIQIGEPVEEPLGNHPEAAVFKPLSHVFADMALLDAQPAALAYGPLSGDATNKFRLTSGFTAVGNTVNAYAITNSIVMLQRDAADSNRVNLVLKPFSQPGIDFTPVRYYVYRGLKATDFLKTVNPGETEVRAKAGALAFVTRLYALHEAQNTPGTALLLEVLGYKPATQLDNLAIDDVFFEGDGEIQLPFAARGMVLGEFETASGNPFGLEIILEEGNYQPNFEYARVGSYMIDRTGQPADLADRVAREEILNFVDPAAFYGMHIGGEIKDPAGDHTDAATIVANVVSRFLTQNNLYLDIRNENADSYNFYQNYQGPPADANLGMDLSHGDAAPPANFANHGSNSWPITILNSAVNTNAATSALYLALRKDDNVSPVLYIERGTVRTATTANRFVARKELYTGPAVAWTSPVGFDYDNTGPNGAKLPVANVIKLHYARELEHSTVWPATVVPTEGLTDNLFGPLNVTMPWSQAANIAWISMEDKKFVDGRTKYSAYMAERGLAYEGFDVGDPNVGRVIFYAVADDHLRVKSNKLKGNGITGGISSEASFFQAANVFQGLKLKFYTINDAGNDVTVFRFVPSKTNLIYPSSVLALGITRTEFETLAALPGFAPGYPRRLGLEQVGSGLFWKKYKLKVKGLDPAGNYFSAAPAVDIVVYSRNPFIFCSDAFAQEEPVPSVYVRNFEERMGLQENGLQDAFTILTSTASSHQITVSGKDAAEILQKDDELSVTGDPQASNNRKQKVVSASISGNDTVVVLSPGPKVDSAGGFLNYPGKVLEDYCIDKDTLGALAGNPDNMRKLVDDFATAIQAAGDKASIEAAVDLFGPKILNRARAAVKDSTYANPDDRILYWARIRMMVILKSHSHLLGNFNDRDELVEKFDRHSRGYGSVDFSAAPLGAQKVLITGFDPFFLNGSDPNHNVLQANPSGSIALALHGETIMDGPTAVAYVQSALLPVRFEDFEYDGGEGVVEKFYSRYIDPNSVDPNGGAPNYVAVDMVFTVSQALERYIWVDRFAARFRVDVVDNSGHFPDEFPAIPAGEPFYETSLPYAAMVPAANPNAAIAGWDLAKADFNLVLNQRFGYADTSVTPNENHGYPHTNVDGTKLVEANPRDNDLVKDTGGPASGLVPTELPNQNSITAGQGSGGAYLSNESFYRVSRMRAQFNPALNSGHLHVPKLQSTVKVKLAAFGDYPVHIRFPRANTKALIERVYDIFKDATK